MNISGKKCTISYMNISRQMFLCGIHRSSWWGVGDVGIYSFCAIAQDLIPAGPFKLNLKAPILHINKLTWPSYINDLQIGIFPLVTGIQ